jgi:NAD+ synthase
MRKIDVPLTIQRLTDFIQNTLASAGFSRLLVAVSGGVDSGTALALAAVASGPGSIHVLMMPYGAWHAAAQRRAQLLIKELQIPTSQTYENDIAPMADRFFTALGLGAGQGASGAGAADLDRIRAGNIMARVRMVLLFDQARRLNALVLGTENKSEHLLGYYTRFGDEASDIEPLRNLYKTEVYQLAEHLKLPREILDARPSAGLWPGQTDEGQFGFTYEEADQVLYGLYEAGLSAEELAGGGLQPEAIQKVQAWVESVEFKHHLPYLAPDPVIVAA